MGAMGPSAASSNLTDDDILWTLQGYANFSRSHDLHDEKGPVICFSTNMISTDGIWAEENPLDYSLPLFVLQSIIVVLVTRGLNLILGKFRQPRFIADILGGIMLGPSVLGTIPSYSEMIFPTRSMPVLETMAQLGLVFYIFLVGLHVDIDSVNRAGQKAWVLTVFGVTLPFFIQTIIIFVFLSRFIDMSRSEIYVAFLGVSATVTAYPVLARILAELKLLHTETGKVALSSSILNDGIACVLLAVAIALTGSEASWIIPCMVVSSGILFTVFVYYTVRPSMKWIVSQVKEGRTLDDVYVVMVLLLVMAGAMMADMLGIHAVFGAFTMGVVVPKGPLVPLIMEKLEDFVSGFLLPLFFVEIGVNTNMWAISQDTCIFFMAGMLIASAARIMGIMITTTCYGAPLREGLILGILMSTKGIMELIVLHMALEKKVLNGSCYSAMVLVSVFQTMLVTPLTLVMHRHACHLASTYKRRTIQGAKPDSELRMVTCIHSTRDVPSTISLLRASNPTKRSPVFAYNAYLIELTGRESAMLIVHDTQQVEKDNHHHSHLAAQGGNLNRIQVHSEQINKAFKSYEQHAGGVSVQTLTIASAYPTMHEDICTLAEEKHAALLILPFHKHLNVDGGMELTNPGILTVNQNVLSHAPCSVAILVDRGLSGATSIVTGCPNATCNIALLFMGGPDDREALAYASRMVDQPCVNLTVLRFVNGSTPKSAAAAAARMVDEEVKEKMMDEYYLKEFRIKTMGDESVKYVEKAVMNGEETVEAIREIDSVHNLYMVGRGDASSSSTSPLTAGLTDWTENPELGAIGDFLSSSDFTSMVSVLVIQQYKGIVQPEGVWGCSLETLIRPAKLVQQENKLGWDEV